MTEPKAQAVELLPCPNGDCRSSNLDILIRCAGDAPLKNPQGYVECWDCGVRGPMTCGYSGASFDRCSAKAKSEAAELWNGFVAALASAPPTNAPSSDYVLVPREPTEAMLEMGCGPLITYLNSENGRSEKALASIWKYMVEGATIADPTPTGNAGRGS